MIRHAKLLLLLLVLAALPFGCKKDTCKECTSWEVCPLLTKQCPGWTMTVQQCSGSCCTTDPAQLSCTMDFPGQVLRQDIVGASALIEIANGSERTLITIDGRANGWVTAAMPAAEMRCVMEGKLAEIRAAAKTRQ